MRANDTVIRERAHQTKARLGERRFNALVWHRRAGKSHHLVTRMLGRMLAANRPDWQAAYVAPTRKQAAQIAEPYFLQYTQNLRAKYNKSDMKLEIPGAGWITMYSGENYDRMRGLYLDDVTMDECAHIPSAAWTQVVSAAISDRLGSCTFAGTPNGMQNLLYEVMDYAQTANDPDWSHSLLRWMDTGAVAVDEIERNRKMMSEEEFSQEWECSFGGALRGAYYAKEIAAANAEGRVTTVRHDATLPVYVAADLGWSDLMVVIWFQIAATEVRILRCRAYQHTAIPDMVRDWRDFEPIDLAILPHDARVRELGTGSSREETFNSLGVDTMICPQQGVHEGIAQVRQLLPHCWFDGEETKMLREGLQSYRAKYDETRRVHSMTPEHSWASHYADAMRYLAVGRPSATSSGRKRKLRATI